MNQFRIKNLVLLCYAAACLPSAARASLIDGSLLHIVGNGELGTTSTTWVCNQPADAACSPAPVGQGDFSASASSGSFAQYNGTFGLIRDINNALQPLNTTFSLPNFITFDLNSDITIELTFIPLGIDTVSATCAGLAHCTPQNNLLITPNNPGGVSAYNLDQDMTGTKLTFGVDGIVHQAGGATADLSGTFTAEFSGLNPQQTLTLINSGSSVTYAGDFTLSLPATATPEPASMVLSGMGLLGLALVRFRYHRL